MVRSRTLVASPQGLAFMILVGGLAVTVAGLSGQTRTARMPNTANGEWVSYTVRHQGHSLHAPRSD